MISSEKGNGNTIAYVKTSEEDGHLIKAAPLLLETLRLIVKTGVLKGLTFKGVDENVPEAEIDLHYEAQFVMGEATNSDANIGC